MPPNLTESNLLDFVEGVAITPDVAARVNAAMTADPHLAAWVRAVQADRAALIALPGIKAPAGLLEAVEAELDGDVLVSALNAEYAASGPVPVVVSRPLGPGVLVRIGRSPILALAAMLALAAGAAWLSVRGGSSGPRATPLARSGGTVQTLESTPSAVGVDATTLAVSRSSGGGVATEPPAGAPGEERLADAAPPEPNEPPGTLMARSADHAPNAPAVAPPWGLPLDRALALAAEGRLLIEIDSAELDRTATRLDALVRTPGAGLRVHRHVAAAAARLVAVERARIDAEMLARDDRALAQGGQRTTPSTLDQSGEGAATVRAPAASPSGRAGAPPSAPPAILPGTFEAQLPANEAALEALLRRLSAVGRQRARLVELDAAAAATLSALTPGQELVGPPVEFARDTVARVAVPIVVRER